MGIYRGAGGSGDAVNDASSEALITIQARDAALAAQAAAEAAQTAAELAETNAETAETNAETAETNAETAATNAASSASAASTSASNAASSASAASTSASNASTSASNAASSASAASTSASNAAASASTATTQATNASNSASAAATSATNASNSASAAATSATNAANSATAAQTAQTAAELAETNAETAEANAETAETNAAASASAAATSASNASTSASNAATSATNASNSASAAATSATNASNSASAAATSATNASNSATSAASSASNAAASYDSFDDRYLGAKSSAPTLDNDGNTLLVGALYYDTVSSSMKVWSGSAWLDAYASLSGALLATNNLSDLNNTATARTNLGVAIGTDVQAYDADTAKLDVAQSWSAAQSFNAGVTLGDASGDALTINSSAVSIPNGLNFDSNTFVIDATNNRVGVGTASPLEPLQVQQNSAGASPILLSLINDPSVGTNATGVKLWMSGRAVSSVNRGAYIEAITTNTSSAHALAFAVSEGASAPAERMRINPVGNVGIGTANPLTNLHISSGESRLRLTATNASGNSWELISGGGGITGAGFFSLYDLTNASQRVVVASGSGEAMRITSAGNVVVGATSPAGSSQITAYGATNGQIAVQNSTNWSRLLQNSGDLYIDNNTGGSAGNTIFRTSSSTTERMRIDSSGNVLIGATTQLNSEKQYIYQSANGMGLQINCVNASQTDYAFRIRVARNTTNGTFNPIGYYNDGAGAYRFWITDNGGGYFNGNVGIGTSSPSYQLTVSQATTGYIFAVTDGTSTFGVANQGGSSLIGTITNHPLRFGTNDNERMRIDSSGNVSIGTSTAFSKFGVSTTNGNLGITGGNTSGGNKIQSFGATTTSNGYLAFEGYSVEYMRIDSSGNVGIGTSSVFDSNTRLELSKSGNCQQFISSTDASGVRIYLSAQGSTSANFGAFSNHPLSFRTNDTERGRFDTSGNFLFNSGYGSVATAYGCRAWVRFNGTGTISINASGNVSSLTDNGTGDYTINFTNAMPDANYSMAGTAQSGSATRGGMASPKFNGTYSTSAVQVFLADSANAFLDSAIVGVQIFR